MISWYMGSSCTGTPAACSARSVARRLSGCNAEEALGFPHAVGERVDVVVAGVHVERGPGGGRHAVAADHGPGAVVPHAHGDAEVVEHLADVVRVDALDGERDC